MTNFRKFAAGAVAVPVTLMFAGTAYAATGSASGNLEPLNESGASGMTMADVADTEVTVTIQAQGLLADMPHAQHIHYGDEARNECPSLADDADGDGWLNVAEGVPAYGPIAVSLTTEGDTSADSGLAVDRYPTAPGGTQNYERTMTVDQATADAILAGEAVVVIHGVDYNGNGEYDAEAGASELDESLPREATDPALCARLVAAPMGGAATGGGGTVDVAGFNPALLGLGAAVVLAFGAGTVLARRRGTADDAA